MLANVPRGPLPVASLDPTESSPESTFFEAEKIAATIKDRWRRGQRPDAQAALSEQPDLYRYRTLVLDLAYHEFRLRQQSGEAIDAERFSQRFANLQQSLYVLIAVRSLLAHDVDLGALQTVLTWPKAGDSFLQFELQSQIGQGAVGRVFLATQSELGGRQVVVKVAPHAGVEASILGRLIHTNIVPIYSLEHDETTGLEAFCMPYLGQATLADVLNAFYDRKPPKKGADFLSAIARRNGGIQLPETRPSDSVLLRGSYVDSAIHIVAQLADALAHSHGRGIFHRDLKPSNVLLTPWGQPLLLDFNLSVDVNLPVCKIGGTLPYMAPEEVQRFVDAESVSSAQHYDPRSDVFSLAVIAYELLTLQSPFGSPPNGSSLSEIAGEWLSRQKEGPAPIRTFNPEVNRSLAELIERCLALDPEERPPSAEKLGTALRRQLNPVRRIGRWVSMRKLPVATVSALLLAMVVTFTAALASRPSRAERYLSLGLAHFKEGQYPRCVSDLTDLLVINPGSYDAYLVRGHAHKRLGNFALAAADYRSACRLQPNAIAHGCEAYCLTALRDYRSATPLYHVALAEKHPSSAILNCNLGFCYLVAHELGQAEKHLSEAIRLDDGLQVAHYSMALCHLQRSLNRGPIAPQALVHIKRALEIGPESTEVNWLAGAVYTVAARNDPTALPLARKYILRAVECGKRKDEYQISLYEAVRSDPAFVAKLSAAKKIVDVPKQQKYIDPSP